MAEEREPPPLFGEDNVENDPDSDDLFKSASDNQSKTAASTFDDVEVQDDDDREDIFADAKTEVPLDSPEEPANPFATDSDDTPQLEVQTETIKPSAPVPAEPAAASPVTDEEREEARDEFSIEITVTEPKKIGDGMSAYMAYKVTTRTSLPQFTRRESSVYRRFSDFLGLHEKLMGSHHSEGRIIPPPPEKSVVGMTKIKVTKEDSGSHDFVEKRRTSLERFLTHIGKHPVLRVDSDFREFLEVDGDLPKSHSTSALSGAGVMRLFSKVGDSLGKIAFKMDETDTWFEEKQGQVEALDAQLRKLHASVEALVGYRRDLSLHTGGFSRCAAMLGNAEEHTALSRALAQLAEVEERVEALHSDQADADFFVLAELLRDYINLLGAVKETFNERVKIYKNWKEAEANLAKKQEQRAKLEQQRKLDKIPPISQEITQWEDKVDKGQKDFEKISKNIRTEMARFEKQKARDFKAMIINYLETLMNNQQQLIKYWEGFLPEAKAIA